MLNGSAEWFGIQVQVVIPAQAVIPAHAGIQVMDQLDSRIRGNDGME